MKLHRHLLQSWKITLALLFLTILILGGILIISTEFDHVLINSLFERLEFTLVISLLLLSCINFALRSIRWHWFTQRLGLAVPIKESAIYYIAGFSMGVTPGRMGEVIRLWMLRRTRKISYHRALPLLIADRINDLLAVIVLTLCAGMMIENTSLGYLILAFSLIILSNILLRHPYYLMAVTNGLYAATGRWRKIFAATRRMLRTGREMFSLLTASLASTVSILAWFAECLAFYLLLSGLGSELSLETATFIYAFATLVGALSFLPGGLGGFEATAVILLGANGVDIGSAVFATSVIRVTTLWFSVALGSIIFTYFLIGKGLLNGESKHPQEQPTLRNEK